jgi:membrane protein
LFQPAIDINRMTVSFVLGRLERRGTEHHIFVKSREYNKITSMLEKFDSMISASDSNILVKDL